MQAGYESKPHLGTPLDEATPSPCARAVKNSFSQQVYNQISQYPDLSMSERDSVFRRQPLQLRGMTLQRVPNGGFGPGNPSILVGAGPDGIDINTRLPSLFTQPSERKRMTVMPDRPLTGENGAPAVYRAPDHKLRNAHGAMSTSRAAQEAASGQRKMHAARAALLASAFPDTADATQRSLDSRRRRTRARAAAETTTPTPTTTPTMTAPLTTTAMPTPAADLAVVTGGLAPAAADACTALTFSQFWDNMGRLLTGRLKDADGNTILSRKYVGWYVGVFVALLLLVVFFIVMVVKAAQEGACKKALKMAMQMKSSR